MNLIWHITKKDLRRLTGPLVGLVLVEVIKVLIGLALRSGDGVDFVWFGRMELYLNLARGAEALVNFILVGLLVHEDALVGMQVFWRTRPISNGLLLRSKLLTGALIFGVLPILIALPWWLVCGMGPASMAGAAFEMLAWSAVVVVPASALALMSDNLGRYISTTVIGYALGTFSLLMAIAYLPSPETINWAVMQSRSFISLVLILVGWLAIIAWQFRRRSLLVPYAILTILVIIIPQVMWAWPKDIFAASRPHRNDSSAETRDIVVTAGPATVDYTEGTATTVDLTLRANQLPRDRVFTASGADLTWQTRGGQRYASGFSNGYGGNYDVIRAMLGVATIPPDGETARWVEEKRLERMKKHPESYHAMPPPLAPEEARKVVHLRFILGGTAKFEPPAVKYSPELRMDVVYARPQKLGELPIQPSDWLKIDGLNVRITQVHKKIHPAASNFAATAYEETNFHFVATDPDGESIAPLWRLFHLGAPKVLPTNCWLISPELGTAYNSGSIGAYNPGVRIDGVQVVWRTANIAEPRVVRNGIWTGYLPDWDKKFRMVFVSYTVEGEFRRTVKLEQIKQNRKEQEEPAEPAPGN